MLVTITDWLWSYVLIVVLIGVGLRFSVGSRFAQLRLFGAMFSGLLHSHLGGTDRGISGFQALVVSIAGRVGGGNIAGVAVAIALGGPGALFWMWLIALIGMATSLFECAIAQLFKHRHTGEDFRGGPAYYMRYGLGWKVLPVVYSVLLLLTIGVGFNAVQSYALTQSVESAFGIPAWQAGLVLTAFMGVILFGGIRRIALFAEIVVPLMVAGYFIAAVVVVVLNISEVPAALGLIIKSAFGFDQVMGGGLAAAVMQGARRGLFSNEAGLGTAPNVAAVADVPHPISQGLVQALSVFIDTMILCTSTALIILLSSVYQPEAANMPGVTMTQLALAEHLGYWGEPLVSIALVMFAVTSIAYNCYLGENAIAFFDDLPRGTLTVFRIFILVIIAWASMQDLGTIFSFSDLTMALLALTNLYALWKLYPVGIRILRNFEDQRRAGQAPVFDLSKEPTLDLDPESWGTTADPERTG
ncbi:amino acid carrier protein [Luminiphilus syltensis NOR5-1B]|uniref:Amino acid carrier protein n=1 Tax=Luminiphilus syltensis NOR5-1B TaxID=565045 RepID=B8KQL6_9GAMM|nr:alanine/glycine:cation symporter family protein [Luminiphilus syltensis]EED35386.1 amino acid carrier protein [Luminiphilus syltensis NOR5-1B]